VDKTDDILPLTHPFTAIVAGPTSCGKTRFVFRLTDNVAPMTDPPPSKIYCYREYHQLFCNYPRVIFHQGVPDLNDFDDSESTTLVVEDLTQETNETVANLFINDWHYRNVSVMFLAQNLFPKKQIRTDHESECQLYESLQKFERCQSLCESSETDISK